MAVTRKNCTKCGKPEMMAGDSKLCAGCTAEAKKTKGGTKSGGGTKTKKR